MFTPCDQTEELQSRNAVVKFSDQVKYVQPVESIRQESVHRSCPKDLQGTGRKVFDKIAVNVQ